MVINQLIYLIKRKFIFLKIKKRNRKAKKTKIKTKNIKIKHDKKNISEKNIDPNSPLQFWKNFFKRYLGLLNC